ncbi:MAG: hypothetical protein RLZZ299_1514 [Pseudomonadota bacterium]
MAAFLAWIGPDALLPLCLACMGVAVVWVLARHPGRAAWSVVLPLLLLAAGGLVELRGVTAAWHEAGAPDTLLPRVAWVARASHAHAAGVWFVTCIGAALVAGLGAHRARRAQPAAPPSPWADGAPGGVSDPAPSAAADPPEADELELELDDLALDAEVDDDATEAMPVPAPPERPTVTEVRPGAVRPWSQAVEERPTITEIAGRTWGTARELPDTTEVGGPAFGAARPPDEDVTAVGVPGAEPPERTVTEGITKITPAPVPSLPANMPVHIRRAVSILTFTQRPDGGTVPGVPMERGTHPGTPSGTQPGLRPVRRAPPAPPRPRAAFPSVAEWSGVDAPRADTAAPTRAMAWGVCVLSLLGALRAAPDVGASATLQAALAATLEGQLASPPAFLPPLDTGAAVGWWAVLGAAVALGVARLAGAGRASLLVGGVSAALVPHVAASGRLADLAAQVGALPHATWRAARDLGAVGAVDGIRHALPGTVVVLEEAAPRILRYVPGASFSLQRADTLRRTRDTRGAASDQDDPGAWAYEGLGSELRSGDGVLLAASTSVVDLYLLLNETTIDRIGIVACAEAPGAIPAMESLAAAGACGVTPLSLRRAAGARITRRLILLPDGEVDEGGEIRALDALGPIEGTVLLRLQANTTGADLARALTRLRAADRVLLGWGVDMDGAPIAVGVRP